MNNIMHGMKYSFPNVPEPVHHSIVSTLESLDEITTEKDVIRYRSKRTILLLVAVITLFTSITAVAATISYKDRLAAMSDKEIDSVLKSVNSKIGAIYFNRLLSDTENIRIRKTLLDKYESEGVFPEENIIVVNDCAEIREVNTLFFEKKSNTFFLPEQELTDEEILQIIDFYHKVDYAFFATADNEVTYECEEKQSIVDMFEYEDVNNCIQTKSLSFTFPDVISRIAANDKNLYVGSKKSIYVCSHDNIENKTELFSCDDNYDIFSFSVDGNNDLFISLRSKNSEDGNRLVKIAEDGTTIEYGLRSDDGKIDISSKLPYTMYADSIGNLYVNCRMDDSSVIFYTFNKAGELIKCISNPKYTVHESNGLCFGTDGFIYKVAQNELIKMDQYLYIQADATDFLGDNKLPQIDFISQISDDEFIMFSRGGIIGYKWAADAYEFLLQPYEVENVFGEGIKTAKVNDTTYVSITQDGILTYVRVKE